jgi:hypothetical protein
MVIGRLYCLWRAGTHPGHPERSSSSRRVSPSRGRKDSNKHSHMRRPNNVNTPFLLNQQSLAFNFARQRRHQIYITTYCSYLTRASNYTTRVTNTFSKSPPSRHHGRPIRSVQFWCRDLRACHRGCSALLEPTPT